MISKTYKENKANVLKIYQDFEDFCKDYNFSIDESIIKQADKIKNEIFNLMVLGEAKSGKSTFINAYLGKEVLPMDVRQCTSAIIEIKRSDSFSLTATTAGGFEIKKNTENEIRAFLKDNASIQDEYREIPVTTINNELILPAQENDISERDIKAFLASDGIKNNNIYSLPTEKYEGLIRKYISDIHPNWRNIVTKISITYPLPEAMQGIRIIDSPGVGAGGNVGKIAEDYINDANAIIFVKALTGQALESSSFRNFFNTNCREKNKSALFLVFSRIAELSSIDLARLKEQAIEMYAHDVQKEKILFVDSKTQLFFNKCKELNSEESIRRYFKDLKDRGEKYTPVSEAWYEAECYLKSFYDTLEELSNFNSIPEVLETFARKSGYIQLDSLLSAIFKDYEQKIQEIENFIRLLNENLKTSPEELVEEIKKKKNEINEVHTKLESKFKEVRNHYADITDDNSVIKQESKKRGDEYKSCLDSFREMTDSQIEEKGFDIVANELKTITLNTIDNIKDFQKETGQKLVKDCDQLLVSLGDELKNIPIRSFTPNFTETDFDELNRLAQNQTSGDIRRESGACFWKKSWHEHYHHKQQHIRIMTQNISERLETIITEMESNAVQYVDSLLEKYKAKLVEKGAELQRQYDGLCKDLKKAKEVKETLKKAQNKYEVICTKRDSIVHIHMEIKNYA